MQGLVELNKSFSRNKFKIRTFFKMFSELHENHTSLKDFSIKVKNLQAPWINKGLKKSSKQKKNCTLNFWKNKSVQNEQIYKNYKHLFEKLHKKAKQTHYQSLLKNCQNDMTRTWYAHDTHMANNERNHGKM